MYFKHFQKNDYARLAMVNGAILAHHTGLGKSWAAYTWPLLKVGYTKSIQNGRTVLTPNAPILIVSPGDLHQQLIGEGERHFKVHTTRLDSKETFLRLSTLDATGRRQLTPGFYITSYTQLGVNGVLKMPDLDTTPTAELMGLLGWTLGSIEKDHEAIRQHQINRIGSDSEGEAPPAWSQLSIGEREQFARWRCRQALTYYADSIGDTNSLGDVEVKCVYSPSLADLCQDCFACVVVDEATKMKGKDTLIALGVRQLTPKYRLVMTATPIKNRLPDIFWLLWWACGGQREAQARFPYSPEDQDEFAKTFSVSERNLSKENKSEKNRRFVKLTPQVCNIHRFWKLMAPNVVRRLKKDIGEELVGKHHHVYRTPMGRRQAEVYKALLKWKPKDKNGRDAIGVQLQALRIAAVAPNSPLLLIARGPAYTPKLAAALKLILQILERREQGLVFAPFHDPLDTLSARLTEAGVVHAVLDGRTSQARRGEIANQFKTGPYRSGSSAQHIPLLLAGTECMAEGHSFPLSNNVIQLSYPWALDKVLQSEDRAHRLNSVKDLNVYRLICEGSIDRKMESQIGEKADSAELVLDGHLIGENSTEVNLAELLAIAAQEFDERTKTIAESELESEWPALRDELRRAHREWHQPIRPIRMEPVSVPAKVEVSLDRIAVEPGNCVVAPSGWRRCWMHRRWARNLTDRRSGATGRLEIEAGSADPSA